MSREEQEKLFTLLQERERRHRENPIRYWHPHEKQLDFLRAPERRRLCIWANQTGKSTVGWIEALSHAVGYRIWEVPDLEFKNGWLPDRNTIPSKHWIKNAAGSTIRVPNIGFVITGLAARRGLGEVLWEKLHELLPPTTQLKPRWMMGGVPASVTFPNGSKVIFGSGEQQDLNTEGVTVHWAWVDEPIPQRIYAGLWRGLIRNLGRIWFTMTPLGVKAAWIAHDIVGPAKRNELEDVYVSHADMRANPHLEEAAIRDFEDDPSFSESEKLARLKGEFEHLSSRVWPQFHNGEPYVRDAIALPDDWKRVHVVDPHTARPWAMIWAAIDERGRKWVYREWPEEDYTKIKSSDMTFGHYKNLLSQLEGKEQIAWRVMDPNFGVQRRRRMGYYEKSIQEEMKEYGLTFDCRVDDNVEHGIGAVADSLRFDTRRPTGPDNAPGLIVFRHCSNTVASLLNFGYLENKTTMRRTEKVSEEFKDFADCVRYMQVYDYPNLADSYSYLEKPYEELIEADFE